ncbi:MAG: hypothetical protein ACOCR0_02180, partial [Haloferacaceae archaeon]
MTVKGRGRLAVAGLISLFGIVLAATHVWYARTYVESTLDLVVGTGIPLVFALWIVYSGYWAYRERYDSRHLLYLWGWSIGGTVGAMGIGGLALLELTLRAVSIPNPASLLASIATFGTVEGLLVGIYGVESRRQTDRLIALQDATTKRLLNWLRREAR